MSSVYSLVDQINITINRENRIYVCGNGGSASTASHFVTDLGVGTFRRTQRKIDAWSLADNAAIVTATSNDIDFTSSFSEQLKIYGREGDLLILISASGESKNLLAAAECAGEIGIEVASITGFSGGSLKGLSRFNIHFETPKGEYGIVEDLHLVTCHLVAEILRG
jgi:D-sedoheptulose 7-phosphate isomerase